MSFQAAVFKRLEIEFVDPTFDPNRGFHGRATFLGDAPNLASPKHQWVSCVAVPGRTHDGIESPVFGRRPPGSLDCRVGELESGRQRKDKHSRNEQVLTGQ